MTSSRLAAFSVLEAVLKRGAFSNIALNHTLNKAKLSRQDEALVTELVYGVLRWLRHLDCILDRLSKKPIDKIDPVLLIILRMGLYQLRFLEKIPARAAVYETVELARDVGMGYASGFVNGILRAYLRNEKEFADLSPGRLEKIIENLEKRDNRQSEDKLVTEMSKIFSHPFWLVRRWVDELGFKETYALLKVNNSPPPLVARINILKTSREKLISKNREEISEHPVLPEGVFIDKLSHRIRDLLQEGILYFQGTASQMVARLLSPQPGRRGIDLCAAPGGKTTHLAQLMENRGEILAVDLYPHKIKLIEANCSRMGIEIVRTKAVDALDLDAESCFSGRLADFVLVDAPCSGLGLLAEKPEIRYRKGPDDVVRLKDLQKRLLGKAYSLLKEEGTLFYSTCTLTAEENEEVIEEFAAEYDVQIEDLPAKAKKVFPSMDPKILSGNEERWLKLFPHRFDSEGFFMAGMIKLT